MELGSIWNDLSYWDGILFSIWLGMLYFGKCWIDDYFWHKKDK